MYQKLLDFIKYHNAFTIIFAVCFLGFGITFAASPTVRDSVYSSEETVVSINNSSIISTNLDNFDFNLRINSITEDEKNYYVIYSYQTLAINDGFWQKKEIEKTLTVNKESLAGKDLGLYVAEELGESINYELSYLKRVQKLEKEKGESRKVVTVVYSGLIGKLLDPKEKVIEGYDPVIAEIVPEDSVAAESNLADIAFSIPKPEPEPEAPPTPEAPADEAEPEPLVPSEVEGEPEATSTPEVILEPEPLPAEAPSRAEEGESVIEATSTPEVILEPEPLPAEAPSGAEEGEPVIEATSTPEEI